MTAEVKRLRAALKLAGDRLNHVAFDYDPAMTKRQRLLEWAAEARSAAGYDPLRKETSDEPTTPN